MLMHNGEVIAYALRQLMKHTQNYPTHGLEIVAGVFDMGIGGVLCGVICEIYTDHKSLKYIFL